MTKMQKVILSIILLLALVSTTVFAADYTFTLNVDPTTTTAKLGDTISVDIGISDIDQNTQGINAIQGDIIYDEELFESVDLVGTGNNWSISYNKSNDSELKGRFVLSNMSSVKENQVVARLVAKVKSDATVTTGEITLKDVYSSYGSNETDKKTEVITVNVDSSEKNDDNDNNTIIDNGSDNTVTPNPATPSKTDTSKSTQSTTTSSKTTVLPKAGIASWLGIVIVAIIIVAIIELIKYKRLTK